MTDLYYPLRSLREGNWFKLICGASFQHLPAIRDLVLAYTLAGADCIDVAADPAVVSAAKNALDRAAIWMNEAKQRGYPIQAMPWLMVSFSDGEDPHFRKAEFDPVNCPAACVRPCEAICPAAAIVFQADGFSGVLQDRCYGCGRCLPICPIQTIATRSYLATPDVIAPLILELGIDAIEIHTQVGRLTEFRRLWQAIAPWVSQLKLIAISCPDGEGLIAYLRALYEVMSPLSCTLVWQTDGRPMSGDIGAGATRAAVKLGQKVLAAKLPGYVQLAGGTNPHTVEKLSTLGLLNPRRGQQSLAGSAQLSTPYIAGVAYGSYARAHLLPVLNQLVPIAPSPDRGSNLVAAAGEAPWSRSADLTSLSQPLSLETVPALLWQAVDLAHTLVAPLKSAASLKPMPQPLSVSSAQRVP